jgi:hypothetical protein
MSKCPPESSPITKLAVLCAVRAVAEDWQDGTSVGVVRGDGTLAVFARGDIATDLAAFLESHPRIHLTFGVQDVPDLPAAVAAAARKAGVVGVEVVP